MNELRKEIRRLLWDSFISARMKTLRKQESSEEVKEKDLEGAIEKLRGIRTDLDSLLTSIDKEEVDVEEISSRLRDILTDLGDAIEVLEGWLGEEPKDWEEIFREQKRKRR